MDDEIINVSIELTEEELKLIQTMVDNGWDRFVATTRVVGNCGTVSVHRPEKE
jgi:hypothetical protein